MVKISTGEKNLDRLEKLKEEKERKEREFKERQENKKRELEQLEVEGKTQITEAERKLEDAVATFITGQEESDVEEDKPVIKTLEDEDQKSLEEALALEKERDLEEGEGGLSYDAQGEGIDTMGDIYQGGIGNPEGEGPGDMYSGNSPQQFYSTSDLEHGEQRKKEQSDFYKSEMEVGGELQKMKSGAEYKG